MTARTHAQSFTERFAARMISFLTGMALFTAVTVFGPSPSRFAFYAMVFVLACSYGFRRRAMFDEQRRNEAMEDERDQQIRMQAADRARMTLVIGIAALAVALTFDPVRGGLLAGVLTLPGLLLLALFAADLVGQFTIVRACRRDRL